MKIPTIERLKLMHEVLARNFSNTTTEAITQIIESTRINQGHIKAESTAKAIRELIEVGITEAELVEKIQQME